MFCSLLRFSDDDDGGGGGGGDDDDASELRLINLYTFQFVPCFKIHVNA